MHALRLASWLLLCGAPAWLLGCGAPSECSDDIATSRSAIKLSTAGELATLGIWRDDVLRLELIEPGDSGATRSCTGTRVAPGVVLTARHCVRGLEHATGQVSRPVTTAGGCDAKLAPSALRPEISSHWELDLALLRYDDESDAPGLALEMGIPEPGEAVVLTGYGLTERGQTGALRAVSGRVLQSQLDNAVTSVQAKDAGACVGDSGGPLLRDRDSEPAVLLGVLSRGSASCLGRDQYVNVAAARDWLDAEVEHLAWRE
jgi:hypothetical protein